MVAVFEFNSVKKIIKVTKIIISKKILYPSKKEEKLAIQSAKPVMLNALERAGSILDVFEPGVFNTARKVAQSVVDGEDKYGFEKPLSRELFNLTGLTLQEYDINKSV